MTRYVIPSGVQKDVSYEITVTDDGGLVCQCQGYARKVLVGYITGVRQGPYALCRHARAIAAAFDLAPRQPRFVWNSLTDGKSFDTTAQPRGAEEHMLSYRYARQLEPLETASDALFPRAAAAPERDQAGRIRDLLSAPARDLVITTTGACPREIISRQRVRELVMTTGARLSPGAVTAATTVLAVGRGPSLRKLARAGELLIPAVDYPGLIALLTGHSERATDRYGRPLTATPPPPSSSHAEPI